MKTELSKQKPFSLELAHLGILVTLAVVLYGVALGDLMLWDTDETLYAQISREMVESGDFITPRWNHVPWFCHPPLYFWLTGAASSVLGWSELTPRIPSFLFGVLNVVLVYYFGALLFNRRTGFLAALVFSVSMQIWIQARMALLDMPFLFFVMAGLYYFLAGFIRDNHRFFIIGWLLTGMAVLAKGPVGAILVVAYSFSYLLVTGTGKKHAGAMAKTPGIILFLLVAVPWYLFMSAVYGEEFNEPVFNYFFLNRLTEPVMDQGGPWHYYIPILLGGFLPWTAFLPVVIYNLVKHTGDTRARFLLLWIVLTFGVFSLAATKLPNYILFIYPALSLAVGWILHQAIYENRLTESADATFKFLALSVLLLMGLFRLMAQIFYPIQWEMYHNVLGRIDIILVMGAVAVLILAFRDRKLAFFATVVTAAGLYLVILTYSPFVQQLRPEHGIVTDLNRLKISGDRLAMTEDFGHRFSFLYYTGLPMEFYTGNESMVNSVNARQERFVVMKRNEFYLFRRRIHVPVTVIRDEGNVVLFYAGSALAQRNDRKARMGNRAF